MLKFLERVAAKEAETNEGTDQRKVVILFRVILEQMTRLISQIDGSVGRPV